MTAISLHKKLISLYARHLIFISVVTVISIAAASYVIENLMIKKALDQEAEHFWSLYQQNSNQSLPNTQNLKGFLIPLTRLEISDSPQLTELTSLSPGFGRTQWQGINSLYLVNDRYDHRLYLFFLEENVNQLILTFGILPLSLLLLLFYLTSWMAYNNSKRMMSPLQRLAKRVSQYRIDHQDTPKPLVLNDLKHNADIEVLSLINALERFNQELNEFVARERNFTRDASHELRTPLAIIKGSLDMLDRLEHPFNDVDQQKQKKYQQKIRSTVEAMEKLIHTLLLLAQHQSADTAHLGHQQLDAQSIISNILTKYQQNTNDSCLHISIKQHQTMNLSASEHMFYIVLDNLIGNAIKYTQKGSVIIHLYTDMIKIIDTGPGISEEDIPHVFTPFYRNQHTQLPGFGLGLPLVKRLCDVQHWRVSINSKEQQGTEVTLHFPSIKPEAA